MGRSVSITSTTCPCWDALSGRSLTNRPSLAFEQLANWVKRQGGIAHGELKLDPAWEPSPQRPALRQAVNAACAAWVIGGTYFCQAKGDITREELFLRVQGATPGKLEPGAAWRGEPRRSNSVCSIHLVRSASTGVLDGAAPRR